MLSYIENLTVFLEGSVALDWKPKAYQSFMTINPVTNQKLSIWRQKLEQGAYSHYWRHNVTYSYELTIETGSFLDSISTVISTGDYNKDIDNLLQNLFTAAQHKAINKLIQRENLQWPS